MSLNPCSSHGDSVADDAFDDIEAAIDKQIADALDDYIGSGPIVFDSENGDDDTKPHAANGQGGDQVDAGSSDSILMPDNNVTDTNPSGRSDYDFDLDNSNIMSPPPPYQEVAVNTVNAGGTANNNASGSQRANTAGGLGPRPLFVHLFYGLLTFPGISLIIVIVILWLHLKILPTMSLANQVPVYLAGFLFLILAASFQYQTSGASQDRTNDNGTSATPFGSRSLARFLLGADATILAGVHLFYLKDVEFTDNRFLFIFFWVIVMELLDIAFWAWHLGPDG